MKPLKTIFVIGCALSIGCSVATPRPIQEMSNAEAALKAAKELHADTLAPDVYRAASETFYKAKTEYRLKNFDVAKKLAKKAMRLSEESEFEAYLKGGATPEVANKVGGSEGANVDPETAMQHAQDLGKKHQQELEERERREQELKAEMRRKTMPDVPSSGVPSTPATQSSSPTSTDKKPTETNPTNLEKSPGEPR